MFHLSQFTLYIVSVACYIILPYYMIKNCILVSGGEAALSFLT